MARPDFCQFCDRDRRSFVLTFTASSLVLLALANIVCGQDNFYFSITPESKDVIEGRDVVLRCDVSKKQDIQFHWVLDGVRLTNSSRRYQHGSNLFIQRVNHTEDIGIFHCIATNVSSGYSLKSSEAVLNILWITRKAAVQLRKPAESDIDTGKEMKLRCYVTGNPEPTYSWFKNDVPLTSNANIYVRDNLLTVKRLQTADSGVYSCQASNEAGYVTSDTNFLLNLNDDDPNAVKLDIRTFKKNYVIRERTSAFLHCQYDNVIRTEWYYRSSKLTDSRSRIKIFPNGTLLIQVVKPSDEGAYVCRGVGARNSQEFSSQLLISRLGNFTYSSFIPKQVPNRPYVVAQGKSSKVECIIPRGVPDPEFYWLDPNGAEIPSSGRIYVDRTLLHITKANPRDSGEYRCIAKNLSGEKRGIINWIVSVPPSLTKHPAPAEVKEGEPAKFSCSFSGTPFPVTSILWQRDGKRLASRRRYKIQEDRGELRITKTEMVDQGMYRCIINTTNQNIKYSKPAELKIQRRLKFTAKPVSLKLLEKDTLARLTCLAEGPQSEPQPIVFWTPPGGGPLPPHIKDKSGILEFSPVSFYDQGNYTCTAKSNDEKIIETRVQVKVVVRPKIRVPPKNTTAYEGFPVMIHCLAEGDPKPRVRWDKNGDLNLISNDDRFALLPNGSLSLSQAYLADRGRYGCTAGNSGGLIRAEMLLDVQTTDQYLQEQRRREEEDQGMMKTIIIAVCSAIAYLGLVIGLTIYCSLRLLRSRKAKAKNETEMAEKCEDLHEQQRTLIEDKSNRAHTPLQERNNFPRSDLQTLGMLGKGTFGDVFLAKARGIVRPGLETQVLVKSLLNANNAHHQMEFRRQVELFRKADHDNVVRLLAVCAETDPNLLILEYCEWGDLKQFLRAMQRDNGRNVKVPPLTPWQKVNICKQISSGMDKLSSMGLVHKDLATRNILLCPTLDVKISHLGLCRDVYAAEYYELNGRLVPIRWMAPEALKQPDRCTPRSDMWSFGVLCWEIFTLGDIPYRQAADEDVIEDVEAGQLRPQFPPNTTPPTVQQIMDSCFYAAPDERHSFGAMTKLLREFVDSEVDV